MFKGNLSQNEISTQLKIHPTTLSRWKRDKGFIEAMLKLLNARSELVRYNAAKKL